MNKILSYISLLVLSGFIYGAQPPGLKEARNKSEAAYRVSKEQFKMDAGYKKLAEVLRGYNQQFQKMQKDGGIKGGLPQAERRKILKALESKKAYKEVVKQRKEQDEKIREYLQSIDPKYKVIHAEYLKIYLPYYEKIKKRPKTTTMLKEAHPGRFVFAPYKPNFEKATTLWFQYPALSWLEAMPLGNGGFGCMDFGGLTKDVIQFNHDTLWSPPSLDPAKTNNGYPNKEKEINQVRQLIFEGKAPEAHDVIAKKVQTKYDVGSYQPFAELHFDYDFGFKLEKGSVKKYSRSLDMETGVATTYFEIGETKYERQVFVVNDKDVIGIRMRAIGGAKFSAKMNLFRPHYFDHQIPEIESCGPNSISISGKAHGYDESKYSTSYEGIAQVKVADGSSQSKNGILSVTNTSDMTVWISGTTNYNVADPFTPLAEDLRKKSQNLLKDVNARAWDTAFKGAVKAHNDIFGRVDIRLGAEQKNDMPLDVRIRAAKELGENEFDHYFISQMFQMGRYLLITSSRPGSMWVNLRGIWSSDLKAAWNSDYHHDINIEMSYWSAEVTNMSECHRPLFDSLKYLRPRGQRVAKEMFGSRGVFVALCHGGYLTACPPEPPRAMWGMAGPWDATHIMEHYRFGQDKKYLKNYSYDIMKDHVLWALDWLVVDPRNGKLVAGPDYSPETAYALSEEHRKNRRWGHEDMGSTMSQQITHQLFSDFLEASAVLGIDDAIVKEVKMKRAKLAPTKIGADGTIMEWSGDYISSEPDHRHISHMWAMFPGNQFHVDNAPKLMDAGKKTLDIRTDTNRSGRIVPWSNIYYVNFYARFGLGDKALYWINSLSRSMHPSKKVRGCAAFNPNGMGSQGLVNDANYGYPGAVAEMLLQSHTGEIKLLPALPKAWNQGEISGIVARGGFEISMQWSAGKLQNVKVFSKNGSPGILTYKGFKQKIHLAKGKEISFTVSSKGFIQ